MPGVLAANSLALLRRAASLRSCFVPLHSIRFRPQTLFSFKPSKGAHSRRIKRFRFSEGMLHGATSQRAEIDDGTVGACCEPGLAVSTQFDEYPGVLYDLPEILAANIPGLKILIMQALARINIPVGGNARQSGAGAATAHGLQRNRRERCAALRFRNSRVELLQRLPICLRTWQEIKVAHISEVGR